MGIRSWRYMCAVVALSAAPAARTGYAQNAPDHPVVVVHGQTYTPKSILGRNRGPGQGACCDEIAPLTPHKIIGNVYYVGMKTLATYLITTPEGDILINTTWEQNVPRIKKSVEDLGFKFTDIKYILNNHEHNDHVEGDALAKELSGAQVVTIAESVEGLQKIKSNGKEHPIDKIIHNGDTLTLGGTTLTAILTPGHAHGGTTWTMKAAEGGKSYDVVFFSSIRVADRLTPDIIAEFNHTFPLVRAIPCDVPLSDHTEVFDIQEKFAKIRPGGPNPYIDREGRDIEVDVQDSMLHAILEEQAKAPSAKTSHPE
jgi:metallo-beta-lactamase class B